MYLPIVIVISGLAWIFYAEWRKNRPALTPYEVFKKTDRQLAVIRTMLEVEILPVLEDLVTEMVDLMREIEEEERRRQ
jgi:hypothetical protein